MDLHYIFSLALLVFGFGFVVFFHELGHFLAAKWVGIKVEQFAVGFGHAIVAYRKGLGIRVGSTTTEYEERVREHLRLSGKNVADVPATQFAAASAELGLSETEY